eukprot:43731-Rhodomonas_salina.2
MTLRHEASRSVILSTTHLCPWLGGAKTGGREREGGTLVQDDESRDVPHTRLCMDSTASEDAAA